VEPVVGSLLESRGEEDGEASQAIEEGPCWLPGAYWSLSLGFAIITAVIGLSLGLAMLWTSISIVVVFSLILLVVLWDNPTARFPVITLLASLDAAVLASAGGVRIVLPPFFVESDRLGSSLAIDPVAIAVIIDVISRIVSCSREKRQSNKTPAGIEAHGAAVV
jgi:hypothetical protein